MIAGRSDRPTAPDPQLVTRLRAARDAVFERIATACARAGRDPSEITLVAVSKTVPADTLIAAVAAGLTTLGENRVQEAVAKAPLVPGATWHLVGPLQSNKVRRAVETFAAIESVDSIELARRLDRAAGELRPASRLAVLLQVNVDADPAKAGFAPGELPNALAELAGVVNLRIDGLMTVGWLATDPAAARSTFDGLRGLRDRVAPDHPALGSELSMGMSDDFEVAIEAGATIVRVGRALFGDRAR